MSPTSGKPTTLGDNLRAMRLSRNLTAAALAEITDLSATTITGIERGKPVNPGVFTLYPIAMALGVRMETLMGLPQIELTTTGRSHVRAALARARLAESPESDDAESA